ncbi:DUF4255 domain-containing protein [Stieleria varia]|uniref:Pvc16 N-terminal domain-containing protein n=1 Tax=Stieleria varia TaxID=2528005 RepID=A0A5C5ZZG7_9BACT|nr:DUF4255 domain-containing protein [Stieleria varia]TWT91733.1 hypothetical protein Pla52n_64830 [Stieleria varia]
MPDFNVIANVSATMVAVLNKALVAVDPLGTGVTAPIAVLHDLHTPPTPPAEESGVLAVTLVEAREDATARNRPRVRSIDRADSGRVNISKPPIALQLRYLLTPWSRDLGATSSGEERELEHRMLGRIAQVLYDGAIVSGAELQGPGDEPDGNGLAGSIEALKVTLTPLTFEEQTRFWHAVQQKYRVSLTYDIRVVNLDPEKSESVSRVSSREVRYGMVTQ